MNLLLVVKMVTICMMVVAPATCAITFDLNTLSKYAPFVAEVRDEVKDTTRSYYGLPIIKPPATDIKKKYLYIQIDAKAQGTKPAISVTLQLKTADLYLVAYRDKDDKGKDRAFYFKKMITEGEVFPDVKGIAKELMKFDHDYASIEAAAGKQIKQLVFRLSNLEEAMRNAYGKSTTQGDFKKAQALFVLYSIEMTAEAARFKYIEKKTVNEASSDVEVASLVQKWDKLSGQIVGSNAGVFQTPIDIQVAENPTKYWTVTNVDQIKPDIGILSYIKPKIADT
ncbi:protein synthesis inhibitor PD-S2-like [Silene latifolia]|uniref:protein synthesis inhibitor PD-S2-like n=1 Tax=Silene latifolia TaxID=37657 RepID=UPI003D77154F